MVQWLRLHTHNAGGLGSIPGQGTKSCMPQLKIPYLTTKTRCSQINVYIRVCVYLCVCIYIWECVHICVCVYIYI